ncbi:MAG: gliding motility-associated C-terminal domain-containing protein [Urechidicola sp.]|nr:gliding motility-associated C-terminal domain-containing protein [Urechidicola sp.]
MKKTLLYLTLFFNLHFFAQEVSLYQQFGGHIDFTMIGNTMNIEENGLFANCAINTSSSATLNLNPDDTIIAAYLYWAGSGTGEFDVKLNDIDITAQRTFSDSLTDALPFFSAFYDVTEQIISEGNTSYTLSEFDLNDVIATYCPNGTNFGGWAILVVYENDTLPLNQINIYDGLEHVPTALTIALNNIDVIDNNDAKIGFIAWEGDAALRVNESLFVNGNLIGNPPLNPTDNAFNGTNSFTGESTLYNMDIDAYNIQDNIAIGDTEATIQLTSGQDFVMINTVITKLNSQLPDATISIDNFEIAACNELETLINLTVYNNNSTNFLPANTSITLYANQQLIGTTYTTADIPINGSESFEMQLLIPESELQSFTLTAVVNELNPVLEIRSDNNTYELEIDYPLPPTVQQPENLLECNIGFETGLFDFGQIYDELIDNSDSDTEFSFYPSEEDFLNDTAEINPAFEYQSIANPQTIYVKATNTLTSCFSNTTFLIAVYNCPPTIPDGFSPNGDGINEEFNIVGLYDIFVNFKLEIYNRWGALVYEGNQQTLKWNGRLKNNKELVPVGIYYYVLHLNDEGYKPIQDRVYVSR